MHGAVIAGTHSGCGKTTVTLGILAALKKRGYRVQPFKAGPDYIDTGLHRLITGTTSRNLDLWMCGKDYVTDCFSKYSAEADISVVEGVMGMYDGDRSTANLAEILGLPVLLVVDGYGMAESAGAVVKGFLEYSNKIQDARYKLKMGKDPEGLELAACSLSLNFAGVIFNRIGSERHYKRVKESVRGVPVLGYLPRNLDFEIPHRHLGLVVAEENPMASKKIDKLADTALEYIDVEAIIQNKDFPLPLVPSHQGRGNDNVPSPLMGEGQGGGVTDSHKIKIAVAYDKAFCFYYEDNLDLLRREGAEIVPFSPLSDSKIPEGIDALYIGGGYPELYADELSGNRPILESIKNFSEKGMPLYAECGGFMYLTEGIYNLENNYFPMAGVFPLRTKMTGRRARLGYREAVFKEDSLLGNKGFVVRGHEFHYSEILDRTKSTEYKGTKAQRHKGTKQEIEAQDSYSTLDLIYSVKDGSGKSLQDEGYRVKNTLGSYMHIHFGSNTSIAKNFVEFTAKTQRPQRTDKKTC